MDQGSSEARQRSADVLSRRAADELLITAIFGDILIGAPAARDPTRLAPLSRESVAGADPQYRSDAI